MLKKAKTKLEKISLGVLFALLIIQPVLDVISYWAQQWEVTAITTAFRLLMFLAVMFYAFIISDKKLFYVIFCAVIAVYWIAHMVVCIKSQTGYVSPVSDASNFLRTVHLPLFTVAFVTFFKKDKEVPEYVQKAFIINLVIMMHSLILSYMTNTQIYTYVVAEQGLMGWAGVHNAQSAILAVIVPMILLFAYKSKNKIVFYFSALVCFANLFFVGTKVDYFSIVIVGCAFIVMLIITGEKKAFYYVVIAAMVLISVFCYKTSTVYQIRANHTAEMAQKQTYVEQAIQEAASNSGDKFVLSGSITPEELEKLDLRTQYSVHRIYNVYADGLVSRFGFDRVFEKYDYTLSVSTLTEAREAKRVFAELAWEDSSFLTKCFGYEYITLVENVSTTNKKTGNVTVTEQIYDLENDFPAVFYYSGYVGFAIYVLFLLYFAMMIVVAVLTRLRKVITVENAMLAIMFALSMGVSEWSGNLLRRPNASIYLSVALAYIFYNTYVKENVRLRDIFHLGKFWKEAKEEKARKKAALLAEKTENE